MAGSPRKRARREAAEARAQGLAPVAPVDAAAPGTAVPVPRTMTMQEFQQEGRRKHIKYSADIAAELIEAVSCGVSLAEYCATPGRPSRRSVVKWKSENAEFAKALQEARIFRAESRSDVIDSILTDVQIGRLDPISGRMLLDGHRWLMGKENVRYSDVSKVEMTGANGGPVRMLSDDPHATLEIARFYALIFQRGEAASRLLDSRGELVPVIEGDVVHD